MAATECVARVWMDNPTISAHDHAVYLLMRELPVGRDARGEIVQALVVHVCDRLMRLVCYYRRHVMRTIRLRHVIACAHGTPECGIYIPMLVPRPQSAYEILYRFRHINSAITDVLRQITTAPGHTPDHNLTITAEWIGFSLEDIYCKHKAGQFVCAGMGACHHGRMWVSTCGDPGIVFCVYRG